MSDSPAKPNVAEKGIPLLVVGQAQKGEDKIASSPVKFDADKPALRKPDWIRVRIPPGNAVAKHLDRSGFGQSGCAFHQQVAICQQCDEETVDQPLLADYLPAEMLFEIF